MTKSTPAPDAVRLVLDSPTVEMADDMLVKVAYGETITWAECKRRLAAPAPATDEDDASRDEARELPWSDFEGDHLTDGNGYAAADVYKRCRTAFDAAWPQGREAALAAALSAFRPAPATARGGDAERLAAELVQGLAPDQGEAPGWAWGLAVRLQAALASQPQATGGAVEREAIARLKAAMDKPVDVRLTAHMEDLRIILAAIAPQPAPSPGGDGHIPPVSEATIAAYEDAHAVSVEMGYPSITEALEHLSELLEPAAPSIQKGMRDERRFQSLRFEVVDDMIADILARVEAGGTMSREEQMATLLQLQKDRQNLRLAGQKPAGEA